MATPTTPLHCSTMVLRMQIGKDPPLAFKSCWSWIVQPGRGREGWRSQGKCHSWGPKGLLYLHQLLGLASHALLPPSQPMGHLPVCKSAQGLLEEIAKRLPLRL